MRNSTINNVFGFAFQEYLNIMIIKQYYFYSVWIFWKLQIFWIICGGYSNKLTLLELLRSIFVVLNTGFAYSPNQIGKYWDGDIILEQHHFLAIFPEIVKKSEDMTKGNLHTKQHIPPSQKKNWQVSHSWRVLRWREYIAQK